MSQRRHLRVHQRKGLAWALKVPHPALFWKMRLGKTLVAIRASKLYRNCHRILVVAPFGPLGGWMEELTAEGEQYTLLVGSKTQRLKKLNIALTNPGKMWCLLNKEGFRPLPEIANVDWDMVVLDESHFIKSPPRAKLKRNNKKVKYTVGSLVTRFFIDNFRAVRHRWLLTGTPAPESPLDYFCQLLFLNPTLLTTRSYYHYQHKYFEAQGYEWKITEEGKKALNWTLSKCAHFLTREEVKLGGVIVRETRLIKLPANVRKIYNTLEKEFLLENSGKETLMTQFAGQKYHWLLALCAGFYDSHYCFPHKINELFSLCTGELLGEQLVIWCQRVQEIELINELMEERHISCRMIHGKVKPGMREQFRKDFQAGKIQNLVIQPETMKEGTKMTAASALVYFNSPAAAVTREQTESRHIDTDTNDNALVVDLVCNDTIEEDILEAQVWKESDQEMIARVQRSIRRRIENAS